MAKAVTLGSNQQMVLGALVRKHGSSGWRIGSWVRTRSVLESLVTKGLAKRVGVSEYWLPTPLGEKVSKGEATLVTGF
jgi:diketogulonate reductase-like aldo/keto reductase